jgi:hypothetical protein
MYVQWEKQRNCKMESDGISKILIRIKSCIQYKKDYLYINYINFVSNPDLRLLIWLSEKVSQFTCRRWVVWLFPNTCTLHSESWFSLSPIKTDRHRITQKLLCAAKNAKQSIKQYVIICKKSNNALILVCRKNRYKPL